MAESLGVAVLDLTTNDSRLLSGLRRGEAETRSSMGRMVGHVIRGAASIAVAFGAFKLGKALFVDPIKQAGEFQKSLTVLWANTEHGKATLADVSRLAIKLGADVRLPAVGAKDAADAMLLLAKSGFSVEQSMAAVKGTLLLSTAAEVDAAMAAKVVTQNINAFGLEAKDTNKIVDNMAGFMRQTGTSFDAFADSLTYVAAPAHTIGQSFKETAAQLAILSKNGIEGSMAGTGLRQVLTRLGTASGKAHDALKAVGVETKGADGKFIGIRATIEKLHPVLDKMTSAQRLTLMKEAFGQTAMNQANILLGTMPSAYDKMTKSIGKAGQAQLLADSMTKGFMGALSGLVNAFQAIQLQIGLKVLPTLTQFTRWLTAELPGAAAAAGTAITSIADVVGEIADAIRPHIGQMRAAFDSLVATVQRFAKFLSDNVGNLHQFGVAIGAAAAVFVTLTTAAKAYAVVQALINALMIANPIGLIIVGIAALVLAFALLYQRSETVRQITNQLWASFQGVAKQALDWITKTGIPGVIAVFHALESALNALKAHWDQIWSVIGPIVKMQFEIVKTAVTAALRIIGQAIELFVNLLHGRWGAAWGNLKNIASIALNAVVSMVGSILRGLAGSAGALAGLIGSAIAKGIKTAPGKLAGLAGDMAGKLGGILGEVAGWARTAFRAIGFAIADGVISGVGNLGSRLGSAVVGAAKGALSAAKGALGIGSPSKLFADEVGAPIAEGIIKGFVDNMTSFDTKMTGILGEVASHAIKITKDNASKVGSAFKSWSDDANKKFDEGIATLQTKLKAELAKGQAQIEKMKAKLTPAELQIQIAQMQAEASKVQSTLDAAWVALKALQGQQEADWKKLLADQKTNLDQLVAQQKAAMDQLQAAQKPREVDAGIAGFEFGKDVKENQGNQPALNLLQAKQNLETWKVYYAQGKVTMDDVLRYQEAFDQASLAFEQAHNAGVLAAGEDTNARELADQQYASGQKLLQDYDTWQNLAIQAAAGAEAILTQQAADDVALQAQQATDEATRIALLATFNQQTLDATGAKDAALQALLDYNLTQQANKERGARDQEAIELNNHLVARYQRIDTHLNNVKKNTDAHWDEMIRGAIKSGGNLIESMANAIENAKPTLTAALQSISREIAKYLKVSSPTEKGPMATLDHWWDNFAPTLIRGLDSKLITDTISGAVNPRLNLGMMTPYATDKTRAMSMLSGGTVNLNQTFHETPANADPVAIGAVTSYALKTLRT